MKIFGRELRLFRRREKDLSPVTSSRGGWWSLISEPWAGAWQRNLEVKADSVLAFHAVFACITLIANDIGKLRWKLMEKDDAIWKETDSSAFSPVLRRPNRYQNHIQFKQWWMYSLLTRGNTYVLKQRDKRGLVVAMYLLDPTRVMPMVTDDGSIYYELKADNITTVTDRVLVPASEIIHDRINCLFHPLVGISPIFACGLSATKGLKIEENSALFFQNGSRPSGILMAPGSLDPAVAITLKEKWEAGFSGANSGKTAVLGDGLKYEALTISPQESQLIEQLKWTSEVVCSTFHVPPFKIGIGTMPTYQNAEILNQIYYSDCLQSHIEQIEACLDEGLGLEQVKEGGKQLGIELDLDALLRMDQATQFKTLSEAVIGGLLAPNEARRKLDQPPVPGGNSVFLQQQNFSLEALAKRDAKDDPFDTAKPAEPPPADDDEDEDPAAKALVLVAEALKQLAPPPPPAPLPPRDEFSWPDFQREMVTALQAS